MSYPHLPHECRDKKYTVGQAITIANQVLKSARIHQVCYNAVPMGTDESRKITCVELSRLVEQIVCDSKYYNHYLYPYYV